MLIQIKQEMILIDYFPPYLSIKNIITANPPLTQAIFKLILSRAFSIPDIFTEFSL